MNFLSFCLLFFAAQIFYLLHFTTLYNSRIQIYIKFSLYSYKYLIDDYKWENTLQVAIDYQLTLPNNWKYSINQYNENFINVSWSLFQVADT